MVLLIDQISKIYIKSNWLLGQEYRVADWFIIHFTENNGMAYGIELGGDWGKLALSLFRIVAISAIGVYLYKISKAKDKPLGYIISVSLVFAGAIGNILDSAFYGMLFTESYYNVAQFMPENGGYSNINARATGIRKGNSLSYSSTNRAYRHRLMFTKSTGMMKNGWAFAGSLSFRYSEFNHLSV